MEAVEVEAVVEVADAVFRPLRVTSDIHRKSKAFWFLASEAVEVVPFEVVEGVDDFHGDFGRTEGVVIEGVTCDLVSTVSDYLVECQVEPASEAAMDGFEAA